MRRGVRSRLALGGVRPDGVPVYPKNADAEPLFTTSGTEVDYVMPTGRGVYVIEHRGGTARRGEASFARSRGTPPRGGATGPIAAPGPALPWRRPCSGPGTSSTP